MANSDGALHSNGLGNRVMSVAQKAVVWLIVISAAVVFLRGTLVGAQSNPTYDIQTTEQDLEQEYRDELDKWMLRAYEGDRDAQSPRRWRRGGSLR